ncbi:AzlC family ABC transporter permease [Bifidobacterium felsineum]|uniref:AzlC family ABC transporter permease n=1 Tax=Bifidobacterium felsineum TaxID=2045440 RepID=UPI001FAFC50A|nr:AzlC family ABC transporter permease [Bifidobacterium felsineum]
MAFKAALPLTSPIAVGFLFLGGSYGLLAHAKGFSLWYPLAMAFFIFAGSMEFITINLLLSAFAPVSAFLLTLMVNARHLFYGLSMLGRFRGLGWKKPYLIFTMIDETFAINSSTQVPLGVDRGWFMMFVSMLSRAYWLGGTTLGWLVGGLLPFSTHGIEFVLTALFLSIFLDQWMGEKHGEGASATVDSASSDLREGGNSSLRVRSPEPVGASLMPDSVRRHLLALIGVMVSATCLMMFGPERFMIPAMGGMLALFLVLRTWLDVSASGVGPDEGLHSGDIQEKSV